MTNQGEISWQQFAREIAGRAGIRTNPVNQHQSESFDWKARRPQRSVLSSERGIFLPTLTHALDAYFNSI